MPIACAVLVVWFYLFHKELLIICCVSRICEVWQINMQIRSSFSSKVLSAWWRGWPKEQLPYDVTSCMVDYCLGSYKRKEKMEPRSTLTPPSIKGTSEKKILRLRVGGVVRTGEIIASVKSVEVHEGPGSYLLCTVCFSGRWWKWSRAGKLDWNVGDAPTPR